MDCVKKDLGEEVNQAGSLDQWDERAEVRIENLDKFIFG